MWFCVDCEATLCLRVYPFASVFVFVNFAAFANSIFHIFRLRHLSFPHIYLPLPLLLLLPSFRVRCFALNLFWSSLSTPSPFRRSRWARFNSPIFSEPSDLHHHSNPRYKNVERKDWINKGEKVSSYFFIFFFIFSFLTISLLIHFN